MKTTALELDTINRLYLELSQVATAKTARELKLEAMVQSANNVCRSMHAIVERDGRDTNWEAFERLLSDELKAQHALLWPTTA